MLDIGFTELLVIALLSLLILGPERLPHAIRTTAVRAGQLRRSVSDIKESLAEQLQLNELDKEIKTIQQHAKEPDSRTPRSPD